MFALVQYFKLPSGAAMSGSPVVHGPFETEEAADQYGYSQEFWDWEVCYMEVIKK